MTKRKRSEPAAAEDTPATAEGTAAVIDRISIPLTADKSAIDWSKVRPSRRAQLERLGLGGSGAAATAASLPASDVVTPAWCASMLDMAGRLEVSIIARAYRVSEDDAAIMRYTDAEKQLLSEPLSKIINKYGGAALSKYGEEILLAVSLVSINAPKVATVRETAARKRTGPRPVEVDWSKVSTDIKPAGSQDDKL